MFERRGDPCPPANIVRSQSGDAARRLASAGLGWSGSGLATTKRLSVAALLCEMQAASDGHRRPRMRADEGGLGWPSITADARGAVYPPPKGCSLRLTRLWLPRRSARA